MNFPIKIVCSGCSKDLGEKEDGDTPDLISHSLCQECRSKILNGDNIPIFFDPYMEAKKIDKLIFELIEKYPLTTKADKELVRKWITLARTIESSCHRTYQCRRCTHGHLHLGDNGTTQGRSTHALRFSNQSCAGYGLWHGRTSWRYFVLDDGYGLDDGSLAGVRHAAARGDDVPV